MPSPEELFATFVVARLDEPDGFRLRLGAPISGQKLIIYVIVSSEGMMHNFTTVHMYPKGRPKKPTVEWMRGAQETVDRAAEKLRKKLCAFYQ